MNKESYVPSKRSLKFKRLKLQDYKISERIRKPFSEAGAWHVCVCFVVEDGAQEAGKNELRPGNAFYGILVSLTLKL